ncbi:hypothetical protein K435DRAFT_662456 [Dendrothele bispora CBS 962.96]|uniref:Cora-domain-containing protein n=1 Tax=Dendrothele bispora (strain CBS 962.96) TaxID=1314807 RepID=A0A4S8M5W8_DENBC|nr:hypothetical protein K435DRAFT_662456 [Dendrothele bispora CBS 962.96]
MSSPGNLPYTRPPPSHRHAAPSAPWPWINLHDEIDAKQLKSGAPPIPPLCEHGDECDRCWKGYPQSRFPNWTKSQVERSGIHDAIHNYKKTKSCRVHRLDVDNKGRFTDAGMKVVSEDDSDTFWEDLTKGKLPDNLRVRALFVEDMSGPVLQMLGAKYNIEPFFFSSSLKWIPSRFQENPQPREGDHITVTLTFLRKVDPESIESSQSSRKSISSLDELPTSEDDPEQIIDTQAPLYLRSCTCYLVLDLLSVHLIRNTEGNTLISFHHSDQESTSAPYLHERVQFAGQSVYWQSMFQKYSDPTFVLLVFVWHALYAWDEALETLYKHICFLESKVMETSNMYLTRGLHVIRAHHLHYSSLLEDFRKAVLFIRNTPNPAMESSKVKDEEREYSSKLLEKECTNLLLEIERLEASRSMQDKRLKNVMNLVFSSVNIGDSRRMQELTEAAVRDSAAMKQIAYLSMVFLPASFVAAFFGMNVKEIEPETKGTLSIYFETAIPLTALTVWIVIAFQSKHLFPNHAAPFWMRLLWPVLLFKRPLDEAYGRERHGERKNLRTNQDGGSKLEIVNSNRY